MASDADFVEKIRKILECGVCLERYTNPKILSCVHSFCKKCLVKLFGNDIVKPCPICRQEIRLPVPGGVSGLKTNVLLTSLIDSIELEEKVAKTSDRDACKLCDENEVTHHCLNCSQNICQSCMKIHKRSKVSTDHTVGTLEDIREGRVTLTEVQKNTCNKHKGESKRFYCETCHVLICRDCTVVDHCKPDHQYIGCAEASAKYKEVLLETFPTFTNEIENVEGCLKNAHTAQQEFEKKVTQTEQEVKRRADRLRAKVKAEEDLILGEIQDCKEDLNTTFEENIKSVKSLLQRKQDTLTMATYYVTTKISDSDFLSLFPSINQDLGLFKSSVPPKVDAECHYLRLDQTLKTPGSINLGVLDLGDTKWELLREVNGDWTEGLKFKSVSDIAALRGDNLAVTSTHGHLVIFNTAGELVKSIQTNRNPCGVAGFLSTPVLVVVINEKGIVEIYNEDLRPVRQFFTSHPHTCVCLKKDGDIFVGHSNNDVTLHNPDGTFIHKISLDKKPRFLATDCFDRVVVGGFDDDQVDVIDDRGDTLVAIKPTMNGQPVSCCSGVCCDGSDIYVAIRNLDSGHIHRYDGDGKFLSCIVQGLCEPAGITLTEDGQHLAVVDNDIVKIYHRV